MHTRPWARNIVRLTVTDSSGRTGTTTQNLTVADPD